jgi:hypothetical protein
MSGTHDRVCWRSEHASIGCTDMLGEAIFRLSGRLFCLFSHSLEEYSKRQELVANPTPICGSFTFLEALLRINVLLVDCLMEYWKSIES